MLLQGANKKAGLLSLPAWPGFPLVPTFDLYGTEAETDQQKICVFRTLCEPVHIAGDDPLLSLPYRRALLRAQFSEGIDMIQHIKTVALVTLIVGVSLTKAYATGTGYSGVATTVQYSVTAGQ
ncbi:MAG: hypothetical protein BM562_03225 [Alphaproteobacteria bacterium MedPE-SWcel]|nr:MAG: hypothetical protein BM562_03225 [Alphaproteobacteria bacterium MedPE-SWcel]